MNKKERRLALATALQSAAPDMVVVGSVAEAVPEVKTKNLVAKLESIGVFPMVRRVGWEPASGCAIARLCRRAGN